MTLLRPYFMKNKKWYYYDEKDHMLKLTDKAPERAKKSYHKFYDDPVDDEDNDSDE